MLFCIACHAIYTTSKVDPQILMQHFWEIIHCTLGKSFHFRSTYHLGFYDTVNVKPLQYQNGSQLGYNKLCAEKHS